MMILEAGCVCPYKNKCPHGLTTIGEPCHGTLSTRKNTFTCTFVVNGNLITDNSNRLPGDQTGRMKVIME
jgi:hypothetical protein